MKKIMDLYVLANSRTLEIVENFRGKWLNDFDEATTEYSFPQYSLKPVASYSCAQNLIEKLIDNPMEPSSIYWNNPNFNKNKIENIHSAMLFFTRDNALVVGIAIDIESAGEIVNYLDALSKTVNGQYGYIVFEYPPPDTSTEFIEIARNATPPKLVNGKLISP